MTVPGQYYPKERRDLVDRLYYWVREGLDGRLFGALLLLVGGALTVRFAVGLIRRALRRSSLEKAAHTLILSFARTVLWLILGLSVTSALGIDVTGAVALAGVLTLVISLALQNMLTNVVGGFTILSTNPFRSGDFVQIGGQSGTVEQIDMTYTRLVTPDNKQVSIPNSAVVSAQVVNYTVLGIRRVEIGIRVAWEEDADIVTDALLRASRTEKVLPDPPPSVVILSFGEGTVEYSLRLWVRSGDYWDVFFDVDRRVQQIFRERHIRIPYPRIQVRMEE